MTSINYSNEVECVLISDEDDDDAASAPTKGLAQIKMANNHINDNKNSNDKDTNSISSGDRASSLGIDDSDGRRVSRRRKNKTEHFEVVKSEQIDNSVNSKSSVVNQITTTIPKDEKKFNIENRAETRSRKRERSGSPQTTDIKEVDPIPYKEILSGLEGAAFQSRYFQIHFALIFFVLTKLRLSK